MDALTAKAIAAAAEVAAGLGLKDTTPELIRDSANALIHLKPAPVVARVATTTGLLRQPAQTWLRRDLEVAGYLHSIDFPVVPPSTELPAGPHVSSAATGSMAMSFWKYVEHDQGSPISDPDAVASLKDLHVALRKLPGKLPLLGVILDEIPHWLKWLEVRRRLAGTDLIALREAHWKLAARLHALRLPVQAVHGDAHRRNLLRTPQGILWTDFEDTCSGPVAWDVATFLSQEPGREDELLLLYPDAPGWQELMPFIEARALEAVVFQQVIGTRFSARHKEAVDAMSAWKKRWMRSALIIGG